MKRERERDRDRDRDRERGMNGLNRRAGLHDLVKLEVELGWASLDWATWIEFQYVALRVGVEISLAGHSFTHIAYVELNR